MKNSEAVLAVKFNSSMDPEKLLSVCLEDLGTFRGVPGLIQKYYITEEKTGAISGIYIFKNSKSREAFWNSALARSIPARYGVIADTLRVEQYQMTIVLNEEVVDC